MSYGQQLSKLVKPDPFWSDNVYILVDPARVLEFVPTEDMTRTEKLNSMSRFVIILGLILTIVYCDVIYLSIPLIGLALFYFIHINYPEGSEKKGGANGSAHGGANGEACDSGMCETAYQEPTQNNPFMNVLLTDYVDDPTRPPAADIENPQVRADMEKMYSFGLYKDVDDIWNRNNSQRQYYTNPSTTIPNDRDSFMKWCWNTPYVCKDGDQIACLKYDDLKAHGKL